MAKRASTRSTYCALGLVYMNLTKAHLRAHSTYNFPIESA